jgi:hypothetical protein
MARAVRAYVRQHRRKFLDRWEECWAGTRIHGTAKRQVAAMFAEEHPVLLPLRLEPFRCLQFGKRTVHLDGCVEVETARPGSEGTGKSHPAQTIGQSAIQQGYRVLYRETRILIEELSRKDRPHSNLAEDRSASATARCGSGGGSKIT